MSSARNIHYRHCGEGRQIVDVTIVATPEERNSHEEKEAIKVCKSPEERKDNPAKLACKERDARWTVEYSMAKQPSKTPSSEQKKQQDIAIPMFGYRNHTGTDRADGFIRGLTVTSASTHDGAPLRNVVTSDNKASPVWSDFVHRAKSKPMLLPVSRANGCRSVVDPSSF